MNPRVLAALAVADFRDRARRPVFVVVVLAAVGLGYLAAPPAGAEYTIVKIGSFRGTYDGSYLGTILALATAVWISFMGFYVVKNAIARDAATRVGEILAATPMRRAEYTVGKFLSNLLVRVAAGGTAMDPQVVAQLFTRRRDPLAVLTPREREVLALMAEGHGNTTIAQQLFITERAVHKHVGNILTKLDLPTDSTGHRRVLAVLAYLRR